MIDLSNDQLTFEFPAVHPDARLVVEFQRTLRIPPGEPEIPRLPSLGRYPLYSVLDHAQRIPRHWLDNGGAMLPMYQSEAMWLSFRPSYSVAHQAFYPFAVKIRVGAIDAVCGSRWTEGIHQWPQDFLVVSDQSWLGGFRSGSDGIRQFVAMPLGTGYLPDRSVNRVGRLELVAYPMRRSAFELRFPRDAWQDRLTGLAFGMTSGSSVHRDPRNVGDALQRQTVEEGLFPLADWNTSTPEHYCLHLANSLHWCAITGSPPPMAPARLAASHRNPAGSMTERWAQRPGLHLPPAEPE